MSRATDAIINGIDPQWARVDCANCGREMNWPQKVASFVPAHVNARPLCDRCDGSGDILKSATDILSDIPGLIERSMVPDGIDDHRLDSAVYQFLKSDTESTLLLTGPTLSGKTTQAVNLVRRWCRQVRLPAFYRTEVRMLSELREFKDGKAAREMHRLCTAPLLIIDDVGTAHTATEGWALEQYMRIVDERYRHLKTVITSNLELHELWALPYIDDRIQRRLKGNLHRCTRRAQ